jgi:hypothetical protein
VSPPCRLASQVIDSKTIYMGKQRSCQDIKLSHCCKFRGFHNPYLIIKAKGFLVGPSIFAPKIINNYPLCHRQVKTGSGKKKDKPLHGRTNRPGSPTSQRCPVLHDFPVVGRSAPSWFSAGGNPSRVSPRRGTGPNSPRLRAAMRQTSFVEATHPAHQH